MRLFLRSPGRNALNFGNPQNNIVQNNILQWRPRTVPRTPPRVNAPLWSMRKQASQIDCTIHDCGVYGWKAVFLINGDWFFSCRFDTWTAAIVAADKKHAELEQSGWVAEAAHGLGDVSDSISL